MYNEVERQRRRAKKVNLLGLLAVVPEVAESSRRVSEAKINQSAVRRIEYLRDEFDEVFGRREATTIGVEETACIDVDVSNRRTAVSKIDGK